MVETIEFDEDEDDELPMLLTQRDVVLMNKAGPLEEEDQEPAAAQLANGDAEQTEMTEEEKAMVAEADAAAAPVTTAPDRAAEADVAQPQAEEAQQPQAAPRPQVIPQNLDSSLVKWSACIPKCAIVKDHVAALYVPSAVHHPGTDLLICCVQSLLDMYVCLHVSFGLSLL